MSSSAVLNGFAQVEDVDEATKSAFESSLANHLRVAPEDVMVTRVGAARRRLLSGVMIYFDVHSTSADAAAGVMSTLQHVDTTGLASALNSALVAAGKNVTCTVQQISQPSLAAVTGPPPPLMASGGHISPVPKTSTGTSDGAARLEKVQDGGLVAPMVCAFAALCAAIAISCWWLRRRKQRRRPAQDTSGKLDNYVATLEDGAKGSQSTRLSASRLQRLVSVADGETRAREASLLNSVRAATVTRGSALLEVADQAGLLAESISKGARSRYPGLFGAPSPHIPSILDADDDDGPEHFVTATSSVEAPVAATAVVSPTLRQDANSCVVFSHGCSIVDNSTFEDDEHNLF